MKTVLEVRPQHVALQQNTDTSLRVERTFLGTGVPSALTFLVTFFILPSLPTFSTKTTANATQIKSQQTCG